MADIERALTDGFGVVVEREGHIIAGLLVDIVDGTATLRRVSVLPSASGQGVARSLVEGALTVAADLGARRASLFARQEFPELVEWWRDHGFDVIAPEPHGSAHGPGPAGGRRRARPPTTCATSGRRLAGVLRTGDVIVATGDLGAGKTTLTQGIGAGLDVEGPIISPTFVISRVHPPRGEGPGLVHVDAYRLGRPVGTGRHRPRRDPRRRRHPGRMGHGLAEWLADDRLEIDIVRGLDSDQRTVYLTGIRPPLGRRPRRPQGAPMTWTLGIDTSHHVAVGIARDGEIVARVVVEDTRAHAEALMPSVLRGLRRRPGSRCADIDEIAVGMGPGPFTGLRVGVATAWTLAHAAGLDPARGLLARRGRPQCADGRGPRPSSWSRPTPAARSCTGATYAADGPRTSDPQVSAPESAAGAAGGRGGPGAVPGPVRRPRAGPSGPRRARRAVAHPRPGRRRALLHAPGRRHGARQAEVRAAEAAGRTMIVETAEASDLPDILALEAHFGVPWSEQSWRRS